MTDVAAPGRRRRVRGILAPLPGCNIPVYGNPGLRSLRSLNPGLNSQHASGVLRITFQRRHRLADEPANRRRNLVSWLPLRLKNV